MILLQVIIIIIFTVPFAIQKIVDTYILTAIQTPFQTAQVNLITGTLRIISYGSHAFGFYFYTLSARIFRAEFLKIINTVYRFITGKNLFIPGGSTIFGMTFMRNDGDHTLTQTANYQQGRHE